MKARTAIFVLGMHRSGTSALARVINLLGASLPQRVLPAGLGNELGHWEPEAAVALHDRLLEAAGTTVNGLSGPADAWFATPAAQAFVAPMRALIETDFGDETLFVFKDPRSALVYPLWRQVLSDLGVQCLPIVMLRNPVEAAASLMKRQAQAVPWQTWTLERGGLLWLRYMLAAERHTRGGVRAFCTYEGLLDDWQREARHLSDSLGITWPRSLAEAAQDIGAFLDTGHRHQRADGLPAGRGGIWSFWIDPVFEALSHASPAAGPDPVALDTIGQSFADVCATVLSSAASSDPGIVEAPAVDTHSAVEARHSACLVVTPGMLEANRIGELSRILKALAETDARITIVACGAFPEAASRDLVELAAQCQAGVQPCDRSALPIEPGFLTTSIELFRHLRARQFDTVLFPDHQGLGYASIVAKQAGLAFAQTMLGVVAHGGTRWQRERDRRFPGDLVTLSIEHIEQKAIESADAVLLPSQEVALWMQRAGWQWKGSDAFRTGWTDDLRSGLLEALHALRGEETQGVAPAGAGDSITVVITHYERPHLLEQNLQALTRQTDRDFSVLVVDDGSRSAEARHYLASLEERYRHLGLRLLRQENRYLGAARNAGIRAAATEFVILLDDDNLAFPAMVVTLRHAVRTMQADVVTCGIRHFHDAIRAPDAGADCKGPDQFFAGGPLLVGAVHNCFGDASAIYRRAVFDRVGYFHELHGVSYEDWQMHLRISAAGLRLVSLPEPLVWYRVRPDSMIRTTHRNDNARVIASTIHALHCSALEPLADFLIGQEEERVRLNHNVEALRAVSAAHAATLSELGVEASQRAVALEQMLDARANDARTAERYAQSLEEALTQTRRSRDEAAEYARSLEAARAEAERHARHLEEELARLRNEAMPASPPGSA